jgi:hypothetical protein
MSGKVRPHSLDGTFHTDALQIVGPHADKQSPNPCLPMYLIVRDVCQVCGKAGDGEVRWGIRVKVLVSDIT